MDEDDPGEDDDEAAAWIDSESNADREEYGCVSVRAREVTNKLGESGESTIASTSREAEDADSPISSAVW